MNRSRLISWGAATLAVSGLIFAPAQRAKSRAAMEANDARRAKISLLTEREARQHQQLMEAEKKKTELQAALVKAPPAPPRPGMRPPLFQFPSNLSSRDVPALVNHPELQKLYLAARRAELSEKYRDLSRLSGLTPEQTAKLIDLLARHDEDTLDLMVTAQNQHLSWTDPVLIKLQNESAAALHDAEMNLLSDDGYASLQAFEKSAPSRESVADFAGKAAVAALPLTTPQVDQLTALTTKFLARTESAAAPNPNPPPLRSYQKIDWPAFDQEAAAILSPAQLELLQHLGANPALTRTESSLTAVSDLMRKLEQASVKH